MLSRSTFTATDLVSEPLVQPAFLPAVPLAIEGALAALEAVRTRELALSLLTVLSARKDGFGPVLGLTAYEHVNGTGGPGNLTPWVGELDQQTRDGACPRNGGVLAITNDVTRSVRASGTYRNATDFGNRVHSETARHVNSRKPCNVRLGLLENVKATQIVCVYDHKTGNAEISMARAAQRVAAALRKDPDRRRIIVIQVEPRP